MAIKSRSKCPLTCCNEQQESQQSVKGWHRCGLSCAKENIKRLDQRRTTSWKTSHVKSSHINKSDIANVTTSVTCENTLQTKTSDVHYTTCQNVHAIPLLTKMDSRSSTVINLGVSPWYHLTSACLLLASVSSALDVLNQSSINQSIKQSWMN